MTVEFKINSDKSAYSKPESVTLTVFNSPWEPIEIQVFDNQPKMIDSKKIDNPDDWPQGKVAWTIPGNVFSSSNSGYGAKAVCNGKEVSCYFQYYN